ncbi:tumor necrosis factor receptor superfamily member 1B [Poeciliopsis prolifica]|uniref:tumor necrosis factor receptor superfamily member 1B n=1 Tax=Poeciliopsis prolifica TaxID=188132 RepID=UPI00241304C2|nr:tumor necrosis factor receptor superfamily member 1B [Poeciliopsis prolifica]XP_054883206.1 tumor necrosis factor receptor superfamily member 1B [Poeciliopsis prolifica]
MKDILVLLLLLTLRAVKVRSIPYQPDSNGNCRNLTTEYLHDGINLCCKKCPPGQRLRQECSRNSDSECEPCGSDQYIETWNYTPNCLSCSKCKDKKGLVNHQSCSATRNAKCVCKPGMFCEMGFDNPFCTDCRQYRVCKAGFRVSVPGTLNSDVKCEKCPTNPCPLRTTVQTVTTTVTVNATTSRGPQQTMRPHLTMGFKGPKPEQPISEMVAVIAGASGFLLFLIIVFLLLILCKRKKTRDSGYLSPKVDANGNCEAAEQKFSQMISSELTSPEQMCLLEKGEVTSDHSVSSSDTETSTRADDFSSHEYPKPLQPTLGFDNPASLLSEPMTLQSVPFTPQRSISTQSSSQPTSPQIVSPVTNSPHVNVNITLHIGNGSCGTPSFQPGDFNQVEHQLPFGQEEESVSAPQQEAGKLSFMSVEESPSYCT